MKNNLKHFFLVALFFYVTPVLAMKEFPDKEQAQRELLEKATRKKKKEDAYWNKKHNEIIHRMLKKLHALPI